MTEEKILLELLQGYYRSVLQQYGQDAAKQRLQHFFFPVPANKWQRPEYAQTVENIKNILYDEVENRPWDYWLATVEDWAHIMASPIPQPSVAKRWHFNPMTRARY
jgi:hypothetical protein